MKCAHLVNRDEGRSRVKQGLLFEPHRKRGVDALECYASISARVGAVEGGIHTLRRGNLENVSVGEND